ncbi:MAG TPA: hypothetical protein PKY87_18765 [Terricaulis sp.]|nr:hypothetical protein [Terricaulis sp.]
MDALDQKLIAAWNEIPAKHQAQIRRAITRPSPVGAVMPEGAPRQIRTARGWVVFGGMVTALARELIEAVDFNAEAA